MSDAPTSGSATGLGSVIRGNVLVVGLISLLTDLSSEMIFPLLPIFVAGLVPLAMAPVILGVMEGIAETTASLLKIWSGRQTDRTGQRKVWVGLGYGVSSLVRPIMSIATAGWHVVALRFADRIGKGIRTAPRDALLADAVDPGRRGLAFSFHRAMDHTGAVLGPIVALGMLYAILGYGFWQGGALARPSDAEMTAMRWIFAAALLPGLAATALAFLGIREPPRPLASAADSVPVTAPRIRDLPPALIRYVAVVVVFVLGASSDLFIVLYAKTRFGWGLGQVMLVWIALHLSKILFSLPGGMLSDRLGRRPTLIAGWSLYALVYLGFAFMTTEAHLWTLVAAYGLFYGLTEGAEKALVADLVPPAQRGTAFGFFHAAVGLTALPASLGFGVLWALWGPRAAFGSGAALAGVATVLLALLPDRLAASRVE